MFKNYLKTAFRQLSRNRLFSALNILGLAIGLCGSIFIFLWVQEELSYDRQNPEPEDIFRLNASIGEIHAATIPIAVAPALQQLLPAVKQNTRLYAAEPRLVSYGDKHFVEKAVWYADSNFQQLFNFPLIKGDAAHLFQSKDQILVTERTAKKYFGEKDPMGQRLRIYNDKDYVVTGVLKDIPANSHIQFDFLLPMSIVVEHQRQYNPWDNFIYYGYLRLDHQAAANPTAIAALEKQIAAIFYKNNPRLTVIFDLQRLTDIHLGEHYLMDVPGQGSLQYVRIFSLVAVFILLIACINFMNLSTALSSRRAKEVGLRKTVGASRVQLIGQFLGESVFLALIALALGAALVWALMPLFNGLTGKAFSITALSGSRLVLLLAVAVAAGLISGSYPALVLSNFQPVKVLKGMKLFQPGKAYFRNGLVVLQFSIAITLMVGTVVVYRQLQFIGNRDMGFDKSNLLYVSMPENVDKAKGAKQIDAALEGATGIMAHSVVGDIPTDLTSGDVSFTWEGKNPKEQPVFSLLGADENSLTTLGMHMLTGRFFSKAYGHEDSTIIPNEAAIRVMHMDPAAAVGKIITYDGRKLTIIGVVKDFNFRPVQYAVNPLFILPHWSRGNEYVVVKTQPDATAKVIAALQKQFAAVYPEYPFSYGFLDQDLDRLYTSQQQMGSMFNIFSVLAIFVSCLGLFGLSAYTTQRRIKEIGVRKVLGASVSGIVSLLAREFLLPVAVATLIAFPLAGWTMDKWLHGFAYRIGLEWWFFALAGMLALFIALGTVGFQALAAARANPIKSLRTE